MVEIGVFDCVKVTYLIVGHTHNIVDQWFSLLSKLVKQKLMQVLTVAAFLAALGSYFKTDQNF